MTEMKDDAFHDAHREEINSLQIRFISLPS